MPITRRTIANMEHTLIVLKVAGLDANGRPRTFEALYPNEQTSTQGRPEFITAWVPTKVIQDRGKD